MSGLEDRFFVGFREKDPGGLRQTLRDTLRERGYECLLHPLGFYFVRLAVRGASSIRLHYWPARDRQVGTAITPYHDHVWKLRSCILTGTLDNVLIEIEENESGAFKVAQIRQVAGVDEVIVGGKAVSMRIISRETYVADDIYDIEPRVFHYTDIPIAEATVTLVQGDVVVEGGPRTLVPVGFAGHSPPREPLSNAPEVLKEIESLLES
jgi:hypothetical protein